MGKFPHADLKNKNSQSTIIQNSEYSSLPFGLIKKKTQKARGVCVHDFTLYMQRIS